MSVRKLMKKLVKVSKRAGKRRGQAIKWQAIGHGGAAIASGVERAIDRYQQNQIGNRIGTELGIDPALAKGLSTSTLTQLVLAKQERDRQTSAVKNLLSRSKAFKDYGSVEGLTPNDAVSLLRDEMRYADGGGDGYMSAAEVEAKRDEELRAMPGFKIGRHNIYKQASGVEPDPAMDVVLGGMSSSHFKDHIQQARTLNTTGMNIAGRENTAAGNRLSRENIAGLNNDTRIKVQEMRDALATRIEGMRDERQRDLAGQRIAQLDRVLGVRQQVADTGQQRVAQTARATDIASIDRELANEFRVYNNPFATTEQKQFAQEKIAELRNQKLSLSAGVNKATPVDLGSVMRPDTAEPPPAPAPAPAPTQAPTATDKNGNKVMWDGTSWVPVQ